MRRAIRRPPPLCASPPSRGGMMLRGERSMCTRYRLPWLLLVLMFVVCPVEPATSALWGNTGELWTPTNRLPDFSFAGYHRGDAAPPVVPVVRNVVSNDGADPSGVGDSTNAFKSAIAAVAALPLASRGAIFIPAGNYKITQILLIEASGIVLRGAGVSSTNLNFPNLIYDAPTPSGTYCGGGINEKSAYISFCGAWMGSAANPGTLLATVTAASTRGQKTLTVNATGSISV